MSNFYLETIQKDPRFLTPMRVFDPDLLEPATRAAVEAVLADARSHGLDLMIYETFRSRSRQQALFDQGATPLRRVGVHHYGLACDLVKNINGEPSWKGDFSLLGRLARAHGLIWGGDWGRSDLPHTFLDHVHVQRCAMAQQPSLFRGGWYPDESYDPYAPPA